MAVSRPVLLALVGAVLVVGVWFATSGSRSSGDSGSQPAAQPAAAPKKAEAKAPVAKATAGAVKAEAKAPAEVAAGKPAALPAGERAAAAETGMPPRVSRALERGNTVVLFFFQPGASDDAATAAAVHGVRGMRRVAVFTVPIGDVARYRAVVSGAGVSQAPAVVIATKKGATLVEGYVDGKTLAQRVADAR